MLKKSFALILSLMMLLSVIIIPHSAVVSAAGPDKVIKTAITFADGTEGVAKQVDVALYSLGLQYSPARLGLTGIEYTAGGAAATGAVPIKGNNWVLKYDYMLEDAVAGIGNIHMQQGIDWLSAGNKGNDLTAGAGSWQSTEISLASLGASDVWNKPMHAVALSVNTTAAVDVNKTYNVYYKNLVICDGAGNVIYTLFDNTVATSELCPQVWTGGSNVSMALTVEDDPTYVEKKPNEKFAIKAAINFTDGTEGVAKNVDVALYSMGFAYSPARLGLTGIEYNAGGNAGTGAIPIKANNWVFKYEYFIEDDIAGIGNIHMQQGIDWLSAGNKGSDLSDGLGTWHATEISLSSLGASDVWNKPIHAVALSVSTTAAVDVNKTYNVYYKNLQICDAAGNVIYTLFDDSVATGELNPQVWTGGTNVSMALSVVRDPAIVEEKPNETNAIKMAVNFSEGAEGTSKQLNTALYSLGFAYAPESLGLTGIGYTAGGASAAGAIPIKANDWVFKYEYMLEDDIAGLGGVHMQQSVDWKEAGNSGSDLSDGVGAWHATEVSLASLLASAEWNKPIWAVAFSVNTTEAVDTNKTYNVYYRNLQIVDGAGEVVYTLFDDSIASEQLCPQVWTGNNTATATLSVVSKGNFDGAAGYSANDLTALRKVLLNAAQSDLFTADLNNDGVVDIKDLINLKKKFI